MRAEDERRHLKLTKHLVRQRRKAANHNVPRPRRKRPEHRRQRQALVGAAVHNSHDGEDAAALEECHKRDQDHRRRGQRRFGELAQLGDLEVRRVALASQTPLDALVASGAPSDLVLCRHDDVDHGDDHALSRDAHVGDARQEHTDVNKRQRRQPPCVQGRARAAPLFHESDQRRRQHLAQLRKPDGIDEQRRIRQRRRQRREEYESEMRAFTPLMVVVGALAPTRRRQPQRQRDEGVAEHRQRQREVKIVRHDLLVC
mmetsp:Transcript_19678/g.66555  ORF Transcript_19678/g.66555 Transcript_19678/m.66555 type:complete len:258 (+) Transcript_19678:514-1287(+)